MDVCEDMPGCELTRQALLELIENKRREIAPHAASVLSCPLLHAVYTDFFHILDENSLYLLRHLR